jgi:FkbM family methyltransferase
VTAFWQGVSDCPVWWDRLAHVGGTLAFDVGANGGETARLFAENFDRVVALEPAEESFAHLAETAAENVVAMELAASDHVGKLELSVAAESIKTGQLVDTRAGLHEQHPWGPEVERRKVTCTTLDTLAVMHGVPDLVKIDVEGHELEVLDGAVGLIRAERTRWMIEIHNADLGQGADDRLRSHHHDLQFHRHTGYPPGSEGWQNHYYVFAVPSRLAQAPA